MRAHLFTLRAFLPRLSLRAFLPRVTLQNLPTAYSAAPLMPGRNIPMSPYLPLKDLIPLEIYFTSALAPSLQTFPLVKVDEKAAPTSLAGKSGSLWH